MNDKMFDVLWLCITIYFLCTMISMSMMESRIMSHIDVLQQQVLSVIKEVRK